MISTSTTGTQPTFDADALRKMLERAEAPRLFGSFMGFPVYVSGRFGKREIEIRGGEQIVRFSENHPYIQGTKLSEALKGRLP